VRCIWLVGKVILEERQEKVKSGEQRVLDGSSSLSCRLLKSKGDRVMVMKEMNSFDKYNFLFRKKELLDFIFKKFHIDFKWIGFSMGLS